MIILEHVGRACFIVRDHSGEWSVDLLRNKCIGQCDCWKFKHDMKEVHEGSREIEECGCPHIEFCDKHLLKMFKADLAAKFPDNEDVT